MDKISKDVKIFLVIAGLWLIQTVLSVGPLRSELETTLLFSLVPGLDLIIEVMKLISSTDTSSIWFYILLFTTFIKDILIAYFINSVKNRIFKK